MRRQVLATNRKYIGYIMEDIRRSLIDYVNEFPTTLEGLARECNDIAENAIYYYFDKRAYKLNKDLKQVDIHTDLQFRHSQRWGNDVEVAFWFGYNLNSVACLRTRFPMNDNMFIRKKDYTKEFKFHFYSDCFDLENNPFIK